LILPWMCGSTVIMRRFAVLLLTCILSFSPVAPLWADPVNPLTQDSHQSGDSLSLDQIQQGQSQDQQQLQFQNTLLNQISTQAIDASLSFTQRPTYSAQISRTGDFSAHFKFNNSAAVVKSGYLLAAFTPAGTNATVEMYRQFVVNPGSSTVDVQFTNAQLLAKGITPGRYLLSFAAFNAFDERLGGSIFGFYGNSFTFGELQTTFTQPPIYTQQIAAGADFQAHWLLDNSGDTADSVTLLTVITPVGTTNSKEFYTSGVSIPAGGNTVPTTTVTAAQLAAAGIGVGQYLVTFAAFDGFGSRFGGPTFGFFGKPLTIGTPTPTFKTIPSYTPSIATNGNFQATFSLGNTGNAPDRVTLITVLTPPGSTNASDSKEFYKTVNLPVNGGDFVFAISAAELAAAGITAGRYLTTFVALNAFDQRIGGTNFGYFGNPLTIGTINVGLSAAPVIASSIASTDDLSVNFVFTNSGNTPDKVYAALVFTRPGETNPAGSIEVYRTGIAVPAGGTTYTFVLTAAQRAAAGIGTGDWLVTATAFNGADGRIASYYGNFLTIGTASPTIGSAPAYTHQIAVGSPLPTTWIFGNTGNAPASVTLVVAVTPVGGTTSQEFKKTVSVPVSGGSFSFDVPSSDLTAAGIVAGQYVLSFVALRGNGTRIGQFFGNLLTIGTAIPAISVSPTYTNQIAAGADLPTHWVVKNSGTAPASVTLVVAVTPVGGGTTKEFSQVVSVPAGSAGTVFDFSVTGSQLSGAGIVAGQYTLTFVALNAAGTHLGDFFGNLLTIGTVAPSFSTLPIYPSHIAIGAALGTTWSLGNTGNAPAVVVMTLAITPSSGTGTKEFSRTVTVNPNGGTFGLEVTAAQLAAAGFNKADQYSVSFVALLAADGSQIKAFVGNLLEIGEGIPGLGQAPAYTNHITTAQNFSSQWKISNTGVVTAHVSLLTVITPAGTSNSKEFYQAGTIPVGNSTTVTVTLVPSILAAQGIGAGSYTVTFKLLDANDQTVGQFFGNALTIDLSTTSVQIQTADPIPSNVFQLPSGQDLSIPVMLPPTGSEHVSTVTAVFTPSGVPAASPAAQASKPVTVLSAGGLFDFHLTAAELSLLKLSPGLYTVTFLAFDSFGRLIGDGFFSSLVKFLLG